MISIQPTSLVIRSQAGWAAGPGCKIKIFGTFYLSLRSSGQRERERKRERRYKSCSTSAGNEREIEATVGEAQRSDLHLYLYITILHPALQQPGNPVNNLQMQFALKFALNLLLTILTSFLLRK